MGAKPKVCFRAALSSLLATQVGQSRRRKAAATHWQSEIGLLRKHKGVVDLDTEVTDRAFELRMTEQKLAGAQIACSLVDESDLSPAKAVGTVSRWIEAGKRPTHRPAGCTGA